MNRYEIQKIIGKILMSVVIVLAAAVTILNLPGCAPTFPYPYTYGLYPKYEGRRLDRHFVDPEIIEHAREEAEIKNNCGRTRILGAYTIWSTAKYEEIIIVKIDVCRECKQYRWMGWQGRHYFVESQCRQ